MATATAGDARLTNSVTPRATNRPEIAVVGWDPYEVWRTRVLLPRLAGHAADINATVKKIANRQRA